MSQEQRHCIPYLAEVVGQERLVERLLAYRREQNQPHALLLSGIEGGEAIPLTLSFARYILCSGDKSHGDACGSCPSCRQMDELAHPDMHVVVPVANKEGARDTMVTDDYLDELRELLRHHARPTLSTWIKRLNLQNKQLSIKALESDLLLSKLSYKAYQSDARIAWIWLPERMNMECANKMLKLLEEPPEGVFFLMVSESPEGILPTIYSRLQRISVKPVPEPLIHRHLKQHYTLSEQECAEIAHLAQGSIATAEQIADTRTDQEEIEQSPFRTALEVLLIATHSDPAAMKQRAEELHASAREEQLMMTDALTEVLREANAYRYGESQIRYFRKEQERLIGELSKHITLSNLTEAMPLLIDARRELSQNVSAKMVFFDLFLHLARLLK